MEYKKSDRMEVNKEQTNKAASRLERLVYLLIFTLIPVVQFYLLEAYEHNPFAEVRPKAQMFNMILFELIGWLLYLLIGRMHIALRVELAAAMLFGLVNHYVMLFRSTPFVPWDLYSIRTAASVATGYDYTPDLRVIVVTLAFLVLFVFIQRLKDAPPIRLRVRLPVAAAAMLVLCLFTNALQDERFQIRNYLYPYLFTPVYMTEVNGMAVTFAMNLQYLAVRQPDGYTREEAMQLLESYETKTDASTGEPAEYPNIIVIMDEAFSELSILGELNTNEDYMPFVHELQKGADNTVTGYVQVSVCGGNTANSEFEFLTGNTMAFLPQGSIPYQQYVKDNMPSLASHLAQLGYQTFAQHPYYASGWERDRVYPLLGFSEMDFINDYTAKQYVRNYVSDRCDFAQVIETFENKKPGSPAFIFNVTMQNHGGYTETFDNFTNTISAEPDSEALDQYLSLLRLTDTSLQSLLAYFSNVEEPTIVLFFGDHQPNDALVRPIWEANGVDAGKLTEEQQLRRYQVPYVIWANYDIPEATGQNTSLNYLGATLLSLGEVPTSAYHNYLLELQQLYPLLSSAGQTVSADAKRSEEQLEEALLTYEKLQYYTVFDSPDTDAAENEKDGKGQK